MAADPLTLFLSGGYQQRLDAMQHQVKLAHVLASMSPEEVAELQKQASLRSLPRRYWRNLTGKSRRAADDAVLGLRDKVTSARDAWGDIAYAEPNSYAALGAGQLAERKRALAAADALVNAFSRKLDAADDVAEAAYRTTRLTRRGTALGGAGLLGGGIALPLALRKGKSKEKTAGPENLLRRYWGNLTGKSLQEAKGVLAAAKDAQASIAFARARIGDKNLLNFTPKRETLAEIRAAAGVAEDAARAKVEAAFAALGATKRNVNLTRAGTALGGAGLLGGIALPLALRKGKTKEASLGALYAALKTPVARGLQALVAKVAPKLRSAEGIAASLAKPSPSAWRLAAAGKGPKDFLRPTRQLLKERGQDIAALRGQMGPGKWNTVKAVWKGAPEVRGAALAGGLGVGGVAGYKALT